MIQLNNLTQRQIEMLDEMWERDSYEDYCEYLESLDPKERKMAETLSQLVILAEMDELVNENVQEAQQVLSKFALQ